jgi:hypothetical protein
MRDVDESLTTYESPPASVVSRAVLEVARYWLSVGGFRFAVPRRGLDPLVLSPGVLPRLWLADHEPDRGDFRFRLAGETINQMFGGSVRDRRLGDVLAHDKAAAVQRRLTRVLHRPCVCYCRGVIHIDHDRHGWSERLTLPLADDFGRLSHILGIADVEPAAGEKVDASKLGVEERFFHPEGLRPFCDAAA